MGTIALVGCSKLKREGSHPARELYMSPLFRKSVEYAERDCDAVYIMSARYDLVELDKEIADYDEHLGDKPNDVREAWAQRILDELVDRHGKSFSLKLLAGATYAKPIRKAVKKSGLSIDLIEPMHALSVGERLQWLNQALGIAPETSPFRGGGHGGRV